MVNCHVWVDGDFVQFMKQRHRKAESDKSLKMIISYISSITLHFIRELQEISWSLFLPSSLSLSCSYLLSWSSWSSSSSCSLSLSCSSSLSHHCHGYYHHHYHHHHHVHYCHCHHHQYHHHHWHHCCYRCCRHHYHHHNHHHHHRHHHLHQSHHQQYIMIIALCSISFYIITVIILHSCIILIFITNQFLFQNYSIYRRVYHIVAYLQVGVYHIVAYHDRNFIRKWTSGICRVRKLYRI